MKILYSPNQEACEINSSLLQQELHKERLTQLDITEQQDYKLMPHLTFQNKVSWEDESYSYLVTVTAEQYQAILTATPKTLTNKGMKLDIDKEETVLIASVEPDEQDFERSFAKEVFNSIHHYLWG